MITLKIYGAFYSDGVERILLDYFEKESVAEEFLDFFQKHIAKYPAIPEDINCESEEFAKIIDIRDGLDTVYMTPLSAIPNEDDDFTYFVQPVTIQVNQSLSDVLS